VALTPGTWAWKFPLFGGLAGVALGIASIFMLGTGPGFGIREGLTRLVGGFIGGFVLVLVAMVLARAWKY